MDDFPAKGDILKIVPETPSLGLIYVLTKEQDNYNIYSINEDQPNNFMLNGVKNSDFDGMPFGKIEDLWCYYGSKTGNIVLFRKDSIYPIKMIDISIFY